jgi:outer membrane protein assembly factor BamB
MSAYRSSATPILVAALNGSVFGIDASTGETVWSNPLDGAGFGVVEIAIERDVVLACPTSSFVFCLDYATGELRWRSATSGLHGRATLLVDGDRVVVAKGGGLDGFQLATGERLWNVKNLGTGSVALGVPGRVRQADAGS